MGIGRFQIVFLLHLLKFFFLLLHVLLLEGLRRLVVKDDEISVADVEAGQMVARLLSVENILVDDKRSAFGFRCGADSDLSDGAVFPEDVVHFFGRDFVGQISDVQNSIHFRRQSDLGTILRLHRHLTKFFAVFFVSF